MGERVDLFKRISNLDGLRGFFSLMVVLFHYREELMPSALFSNFLIRESYVFVDFFFVLSGFVISNRYNGLSSRSDFFLFLKKRFLRLYPMLFFSTSLIFVIEFSFKIFIPHLTNGGESLSGLAFKFMDTILLQNSNLLFSGTYKHGDMGLNFPSWSISAEFFSYVVFALFVVFFRNRLRNFLFTFILVACFSFCLFKGQFFSSGDYGFVRAVIGFVMGYFVWLFSGRVKSLNSFYEFSLAVFICAYIYFLHQLSPENKELYGMFIPFLFAFFILSMTKSNGLMTMVLNTAFFQKLGLWSYSIYINHALIILFFPKIFFKLLGVEKTSASCLVVLLLTLVVVVLYSAVTHKYIEGKLGGYIKKKIS
ncbi:MAG: acyltransferase family protein [Bacteroidales bacterium]